MRVETTIRLWRISSIVSCIGVLQFVVCTAAAIALYANSYSFFGEYLSDLGCLRESSRKPNTVSAWLFNSSIIVLAVSLVPFFWRTPLHAPDQDGLLRVVRWLGLMSCLALAGVGLSPYDVRPAEHVLAVLWWVIFMLAGSGLHGMALLASKETSSVYALLSFGLFLLAGKYWTQGLTSPSAQKYLVLYSLAWFVVFSWRIARFDKLLPDEPSEVDQAAEAYLRRISGGGEPQ